MNTRAGATKLAPQRGKHWARRTHRIIATTSVLFLLLVTLSGIVLNHADVLGLAQRHAAGPLVLSIYGIEAPPIDAAYEAGGVFFALAANSIYADRSKLAGETTSLVGAVVNYGQIIVATASEFFVLTADATLIERFAPKFDGPVTKLGTAGDRVIVATAAANFEFNPQRMRLSEIDSIGMEGIIWSVPAQPDARQIQSIGTAVLGESLSVERVLIDIHSGRILPQVGRYITDAAALCLLYLCMTGVLLWFRRR